MLHLLVSDSVWVWINHSLELCSVEVWINHSLELCSVEVWLYYSLLSDYIIYYSTVLCSEKAWLKTHTTRKIIKKLSILYFYDFYEDKSICSFDPLKIASDK